MTIKTAWLSGRRKRDEDVKYRIFCFSHAGGNTSIYNGWLNAFDASIEICPVILPGRQTRMHEKPYKYMCDAIPDIIENLSPFMNKPFSLFGHSLGSLVAFEVARKVEDMKLPLDKLLVSGRGPTKETSSNPVSKMSDAELLRFIGRLNGTPKEILENKEWMAHILECMRADFNILETHTVSEESQLTCDIAAFMGNADSQVNKTDLFAWKKLTRGNFDYHVFEGDHFYLVPKVNELLELVKSYIKK